MKRHLLLYGMLLLLPFLLSAQHVKKEKRQYDRVSEGKELLEKMKNHYNAFDLESFEADYKQALSFFTVHKQWDNLASLADLWLPLLNSQGQYEREIREARKIYEFAQKNDLPVLMGVALTYMGQSYHAINDMALAESSYREGIALLEKADNPILLGYTYQLYIGMLQMLGKFEETLPLLAAWKVSNKKLNDPYSTVIFHYYIESIGTALGLGNTEEAHRLMVTAEALPLPEQPIIRCHLYEQKVNIYEATGQYPEALTVLDSLRAELEKIAPAGITRVVWHRARIAEAAGEYRQAIAAQKELAALTDSVWKQENARQLHDLRVQFEVDRHILEKDRNRNYALLALAGLILASIALGMRIIYSRRLHQKNLLLFRQLQEKDRLLQRERLYSPTAEKKETLPSEEIQPGRQLFLRLDRLMREKQLYLQSDISRKSVAAQLGSNENYLHNAIKESLNISFSEYIAHLRLEYARRLLLQPVQELSIEQIAFTCGFGSRMTFYRLFRQSYGMSPTEFRLIASQKKAEI